MNYTKNDLKFFLFCDLKIKFEKNEKSNDCKRETFQRFNYFKCLFFIITIRHHSGGTKLPVHFCH